MAEEAKQSDGGRANIQQMNEMLDGYYKNCGMKMDENKFIEYCETNEIEELEGEFYSENGEKMVPSDCLLVDFDKDEESEINHFPLRSQPKDKEEREKMIYDILLNMYEKQEWPQDTDTQSPKLLVNLNIPQNVADKIIKEVYKPQLSCIHTIKNEPALLYFLAVSYANQMPFLTWMVDAYTLDRDEDFANAKRSSPMPVSEWCEKNKFMIELKKNDEKKHEHLKAAMISYGKRIIPRLQYSPPTKVTDDVQEIANYVLGIPKFIKKLLYLDQNYKDVKLEQVPIAPPFCIDLCIGVGGVKSVIITESKDDENEEEDDDDDDDDEKEKNKKELKPDVDHIGNIKNKLKAADRVYAAEEVKEEVQPDNDHNDEKDNTKYYPFTRALMKAYRDFRTALTEADKKKHPFDPTSYPQNRRFGIFLDRRKCNNKNTKNEIIIYEQKQQVSTIPHNYVPEWFINATRESLIPGEDSDDEKGDKAKRSIGAMDNLCGQLMSFNFNVEAVDEIKAYIIWNGQTMRFKGENLERILAIIFDVKKDLTEIQEDLKEFDKDIVDKKFESFREKIKNGYLPSTDYRPFKK